jgi:hypothetical protein
MKKHIYPIIVLLLGIFFVGTVAIINILPYFLKPTGHHYTGLQGFVDDYVGYVSYIKDGIDGYNAYSVRSLPPPQAATSALLLYIFVGKLGGFLGADAMISYHVSRIVLGLLFYIFIWKYFVVLFQSKKTATMAMIIASVSGPLGWYSLRGGVFIYQTIAVFGFTDNIVGRFGSRPHYLFGATLFVIISAILLSKQHVHASKRAIISVSLLSFIAGTVHPSFTIIMGAICAVMILIRVIEKKRLDAIFSLYFACGLGAFIGLLLSYWATRQYPCTSMLAFEEYVLTEKIPFSTMVNDFIVFGPALWIGLIGLVVGIFRGDWKNEKHRYMIVWLIVQFAFFFHFYKYFRSERVRYVQSLYFIPMAYGVMYLFNLLGKKIKTWVAVLLTGIFVVISIPTYREHWKTAMYAQVNYSYYSLFQFPTDAIVEAYKWLDKNSPKGSTIVAGYEASNNILLYSHNYVIGNKQGWLEAEGIVMEKERDTFFEGVWPESYARQYLKKHAISYIYDGYQEPDGFRKYKFLQEVFHNSDVNIYKVFSNE